MRKVVQKGKDRTKTFAVVAFLLLSTLAVYYEVRNHGFVNYDDDMYVTGNYYIREGLTPKGIQWTLNSGYAGNWHPLTWISHMLDLELFGFNPAGHHLSSLFLHSANAVLLFLVLKRMTRQLWPSAFVAALFALHPLHVESAAWIAERKDVLSGLFWMLTMLAYAHYVERPGLARYSLVVLGMGLGLMAKPMLVTLPFVLLLLDYWPLRRFEPSGTSRGMNPRLHHEPKPNLSRAMFLRLLKEKIPLFALTIASSIITFVVQQRGGAVESLEILPTDIRIGNAIIAYVGYIGKTIWPAGLAVFYPYPQVLLIWPVLGSCLLLIATTYLVIRNARRLPYLPVGWFWYVGTLVPVIGLVQVGIQSMADRYTYIPLIGLFIIVAWGVPELLATWRSRRNALAGMAGAVLLGLMVQTWIQVGYWQNSLKLMQHAASVTSDNWVAHSNLGLTLSARGEIAEASMHFSKAMEIKPNHPESHLNMGNMLRAQGSMAEAISYYSKALQIKPSYAEAHNNLGVALYSLGKVEEAISRYHEAIRLKPDLATAHFNLGLALAGQGKTSEAIEHYYEALRFKPDYSEAYNNLGSAFFGLGKTPEAIAHYNEALKLKPMNAEAHYNLGAVFYQQERFKEAIEHYSEALRINPGHSQARSGLEAVLRRQNQNR